MRRRPSAPVTPERVGDMPVELRAGPCIEVWSPKGDPFEAWRRHSEVRRRYLAAAGLRLADHDQLPYALRAVVPWSFMYLAARAPDRLAEMLARRGLPPDWFPVMTEEDDR